MTSIAMAKALAKTMQPGRRYTDWRWEAIKRAVRKRDKHRCVRCGTKKQILHVHHRIPVSQGGSHDPSNLVTLCAYHHAEHHPWMKEKQERKDNLGRKLDCRRRGMAKNRRR